MKRLTAVYLSAVNVCGFASCVELNGAKSVEALDHRFYSEKQPLVGGSFDTLSLSHDTYCTILQAGHG